MLSTTPSHGVLTALTFIVLALSGVLAFVRPFSLHIVGLHALVGFPVTVLVGLHVRAVYYVDEGFGSALQLIDGGLPTIDRGNPELAP